MSVPNETWSERFEREFEAALALLRRRPLLAMIFAGAMAFFAWHQFFRKEESPSDASQIPKMETMATTAMQTHDADVTAVKPDGNSLASRAQPLPARDAIAASAPAADVATAPNAAADVAASPAASAASNAAAVAASAPAVNAASAPSSNLAVSLADYFGRPFVIGNSRKEVSEKMLDASWGQGSAGVFASVPTNFLGQFPGLAILFFSDDHVTQVNFRSDISGSTMRNYRLHGTEDDWDEKVTTNGEDLSYEEATAKCTPFQKLRAELTRTFGAAKSMQDIPIPTPEHDSRTKKYSRPVEEQFDATFIIGEAQLHIVAYDLAFVREETSTRMAKYKLSNRSCAIRAVFKHASAQAK